jgi:hypothetical protein
LQIGQLPLRVVEEHFTAGALFAIRRVFDDVLAVLEGGAHHSTEVLGVLASAALAGLRPVPDAES